jgi:hypothetical protein
MLCRAVILLATSGLLTSCSLAGAPSFELFGAYFPAWMLCAFVGIVGATGTRVALTAPAVKERIPFQLAVCTSTGVIAALFSWMLFFR